MAAAASRPKAATTTISLLLLMTAAVALLGHLATAAPVADTPAAPPPLSLAALRRRLADAGGARHAERLRRDSDDHGDSEEEKQKQGNTRPAAGRVHPRPHSQGAERIHLTLSPASQRLLPDTLEELLPEKQLADYKALSPSGRRRVDRLLLSHALYAHEAAQLDFTENGVAIADPVPEGLPIQTPRPEDAPSDDELRRRRDMHGAGVADSGACAPFFTKREEAHAFHRPASCFASSDCLFRLAPAPDSPLHSPPPLPSHPRSAAAPLSSRRPVHLLHGL